MSRNLRKKDRLSAVDRRILNRLQDDMPFTERPWEAMAKELNIEEDLLLKKVLSFKRRGIVRRISAVFSPRKVDFASTLAAVKIAPGRISQAARIINSYPEVTHNYRRGGEYDLWFALVAKDKRKISRILNRIRRDRDIEKLSEFPVVKLFKINVRFPV